MTNEAFDGLNFNFQPYILRAYKHECLKIGWRFGADKEKRKKMRSKGRKR